MNAPRSRRSPGLLALLGLVAAGLGVGACSRAHLTPTHGRAYHAVFAAQDATPGRAAPKSVHGLDSQEAAIISGSYRKRLAGPNDAANPQSQQLLMTNPRAGAASAVPSSSVPGGN
jgi:hypothetical protein